MRLSIIEYGCLLAEMVSLRSEDPFTKVGGVLFNQTTKKLVSSGYNGVLSGMDWPIEWNAEENRKDKSDCIIHAEKNIFNHSSFDKGPYILCMNISPCGGCSDLIAANNVKEVYFSKIYEKETEFKYRKIFDLYGIKHRQLTDKEKENIYTQSFPIITKYEPKIEDDSYGKIMGEHIRKKCNTLTIEEREILLEEALKIINNHDA